MINGRCVDIRAGNTTAAIHAAVIVVFIVRGIVGVDHIVRT